MASRLEAELRGPAFAVALSRPGASFVADARRERPQIAVIDRIHERPVVAQMEIAVLKENFSDVRIILLSQEPSPSDGTLVEQGVFYYLAIPSLPKVITIVQAAAASLHRGGAAAIAGGVCNPLG